MDGFRKDVETIHAMGFDGKSIINPRQIPIVHDVYTPKAKDILFITTSRGLYAARIK